MNNEYLGTATYSPEDNKLRLYPLARLSREDYDRVKAAGFSWAPKQELFVAPMWTPGREDLLIELCGEVGDEDKSLVERAEERAERFEDYSDKRAADADTAHKAVAAIADNIPFGQPILVGHHSERHARRDAEKIENGMRRAVKMWETSQYWADRAAGAVHAAKYKEQPDVRARRIKGIEADKRKQERNRAEALHCLKFWRGECKLKNTATGETRPLEITEANRAKICEVLGSDSRLGYLPVSKHATLDQSWSAGDVLRPDGERYGTCPAGTVEACRLAAETCYPRQVARIERWISHYDNRLAYERAMLAADGGTVTERTGPEAGGACRCWASPGSFDGGWSYIQKVNRISVTVLDNWGNEGQKDGKHNFTRTIPFDKLRAVMTRAQVEEARTSGRLRETCDKIGFFLSDSTPAPVAPVPPTVEAKAEAAPFAAMKESLRAGVQVVSAPNLFPTPADLAERMVDLADLTAGDKVLEPSAGTGVLVKAIRSRGIFGQDVTAVEINEPLSRTLSAQGVKVRCADFLACNGDLGKFDRIVMNPPFDHGIDIRHILKARSLLNEGGKLVALCANGTKQTAALQPLSDLWEELPANTFKAEGTGVQVILLTMSA